MNIKILKALEEEKQNYEDYIGRDTPVVNFMQHCINLFEEIIKEVKKLEQTKIKQFKHQALLNNCVDDDEVILHKREIRESEQKNNRVPSEMFEQCEDCDGVDNIIIKEGD